jgi:hypothetical protein
MAFRAASVLFAAVTVFVCVLFVRAISVHHEFRSGLFTYAMATGAASVGLWLQKSWARGIGLVVALGNVSLGILALLAGIFGKNGQVLGPGLLLAGSAVLVYVLTRPAYDG